MRLAKSLYYFYLKLLTPALVISIVAGVVSYPIPSINLLKSVIKVYILIAPLMHLYFYEIKNPDEYNFYYNLGLSKTILWGTTLTISLILTLILISL